MILRGAVLALAIGAALGSVLGAEPDAAAALEKERARLEGTWELVLPEGSTGDPIQLQFEAGKLTVIWVGQGSLPAELKLYPNIDPRGIDIEFKKVRQENYEGVYRIDGDTLRLALAPAGVKERPTRVPDQPEPGKGGIYGVFKRKKT